MFDWAREARREKGLSGPNLWNACYLLKKGLEIAAAAIHSGEGLHDD